MLSKRVSLFKAKNLAYNDFDYDDSLLFKPEFSREALYIGIVFRIDGTSSIRLKDISVIGETINAFDDSDIDENNYYSYLEYQLGYSPVIYSTTIGNDGTHELSIDDYKQYYDQGTVPLLSCLFASKMQVFQDLVDAGDDSSINYMVKYLDKTYSPSSSEKTFADTARADFWDCVENLGDFLEELEEAGVETYVVSMFNEMNMYGFYGNKNHTEIIDRFINVWRQVYDYFVNDRELKGILFALRPTGSHAEGTYRANPYRYYPGDDYVDIIAPTVYSSDDTGTLDTFEGYSDFVSTGKVMALSEIGPLSSSSATATADCLNMLNSLKTTYYMAWCKYIYGQTMTQVSAKDSLVQFVKDSVDECLTIPDFHEACLRFMENANKRYNIKYRFSEFTKIRKAIPIKLRDGKTIVIDYCIDTNEISYNLIFPHSLEMRYGRREVEEIYRALERIDRRYYAHTVIFSFNRFSDWCAHKAARNDWFHIVSAERLKY